MYMLRNVQATGKAMSAEPVPEEGYPFPPPCRDSACINFDGTPRPAETYWLCAGCRRQAPAADELGMALRPKLYHTNVKPWGPAKRSEWHRTTNASVLLALLCLKRQTGEAL